MLATIYAKLAGLAVVLLLLLALFLWGHRLGAAGVQASWDAAKAMQQHAVDTRIAANAQQALTWTQQFQQAATHYEAITHDTLPTVADPLAAAVDAGAVRLRDETPASACPGTVSVAASRSRAANAAAAAAATQRLADSIAAVRAGDAADARERQLGAQVIALQAILDAERHPTLP